MNELFSESLTPHHGRSGVTGAANAPERALPAFVAVDAESIKLLELSQKVAPAPSTVLILGESGSGKDQIAQLIHFLSPRRHEPFVKIDCSSLPAELIESELFGYEKGAFTGAYQSKPGRLEMAGNGTLVLDEIAALTLPLQAKLLRVIEEKSFERLGGHTSTHIDARILALTNVELEMAVAQRTFREDLYYRLFVLPIVIPPLRKRPGDILPLAELFLNEGDPWPRRTMTPDLRRALLEYDYPGNVRELRNLVGRARIVSGGGELGLDDFPPYLRDRSRTSTVNKSLDQVEKEHIAAVLQHFKGKKQQAAAALGISPKTLLEKRRKYGLDLPWTSRVPEEAAQRDRLSRDRPDRRR